MTLRYIARALYLAKNGTDAQEQWRPQRFHYLELCDVSCGARLFFTALPTAHISFLPCPHLVFPEGMGAEAIFVLLVMESQDLRTAYGP